ncbi:peptidase M4 [Clostridium botulinum]|uniref:YcdB/YcdC domain-containing protein n=1 Tax=Clostridium botulinum TaxID=1491 RepID=UPI000597C6ED|nr:YcdB/YcdC domain-containing protein [Clostridium botulinum]KIL07308.1 peptidase M4 [Clostridium botulinum]MBY6934344.1 S-layer homology domain-containing protein [Clostridium botulinum]NFL83788.1 S-layer homology domain-containing protein [Clostridium botulinum]NFN12158.1 S-layer homology domain-containing protein [Clostridium botulinum]NFO37676.1 S-layer homology domain-containing protein [Clostridium botulinum]
MKKNYFLSILLFFSLILSIQHPAFADENYSKSLENAIAKTKDIIIIPDTYTDFTYSGRDQKTALGQVNLFELNWSEVQGKYGNISVSIDEDGNILDFYKYSNENTSKLLASVTKDKARQACEDFIKKYGDLDSFESKISNSHINKNLISNNYIWTINFENASAEIDAKSSELLSFYHYSNVDDKSNMIPIDDAKNIANNFLNEVSPNKFKETKLEVLDTNVNENDSFYNFKFIRQVNGINFINNYLMVSINKSSGKVCEYNSQWYDNINFPDIDSALTPESIFDKVSDKFGLEYTLSNDKNISLIYNFIDLDENYLVNPFNGTRIKFNGEDYTEHTLPKYSDINGHWCEKTVKELLENGYYLKGDQFNPDNNITQINFLKYLYSQIWDFNNDDDKFYDMIIEKGILKTEEKSPNLLLTNKDISKLIVRYLGYDKIARNSYIFNNPFNDSIEDDVKGYAAICHSLGIITGDEKNNFNPNNNVTNAEAAKIIYNLLTKANNK